MERGDPSAIRAYRDRLRRREDFTQLVLEQQARLREAYARATPELRRSGKQEAFRAMLVDYEELKRRWNGVSEYDAWFSQPLNNAQLASVSTYRRWLPGLRRALQERGLEVLYQEMDELGGLSAQRRRSRLESWNAAALSDRSSVAAGKAPYGARGARRDIVAEPRS